MRILLIMPDAHMHKLRVGSFIRSMREAPLTLTTLAGLVPNMPGVEVKIVDGSVDSVPLNEPADLVGISVITGCARPAYAMAKHFRQRGIPVVLGGVHVTVLPGEAIQHADSIVIGRGEHAWPQLIEDFQAGRMRRVYRERDLPNHQLEIDKRRAGRDLDLLVDEVDAGDHLGDGMLDLDARVHLDEIEPAVLVEEFDRADADIAHLRHRRATTPPISSRCSGR